MGLCSRHMRNLASFLLLGLTMSAGAAEMWRWKDATGTWHYSDRPEPGAERMNVPGAPKPGTVASAPVAQSSSRQTPAAEPATVYTSCVVTSPTPDQVFFAVNAVNVALLIDPALQGEDQVQVYLDGRVVPTWPASEMSYTLSEMYRGTHTVSMRVLNAQGRAICTGPAVTFHVRQPSVQAPARRN
jgi:hypothetical protein